MIPIKLLPTPAVPIQLVYPLDQSAKPEILDVPQGQIAVRQNYWISQNGDKRASYDICESGREAVVEEDAEWVALGEGEGMVVEESSRPLTSGRMECQYYVRNEGGRAVVLDYHPLITWPLASRMDYFRQAILKAAANGDNWKWAENNERDIRTISTFGKGYLDATLTVMGIGSIRMKLWIELQPRAKHIGVGWMREVSVSVCPLLFHPKNADIAPAGEVQEAIQEIMDGQELRPLSLHAVMRDMLRRHIEYLRGDTGRLPEMGSAEWGARERLLHGWTLEELVGRSALALKVDTARD